MFGGDLGTLDIQPVEIELQPNVKPYTSRFYNIQKAYEDMAKTEVSCLCIVDIFEKLSHTKDSPWVSPSFCQVKKTNNIWVVTDFREVNKYIQRKPFPLPRINESLQKIEKFKSTTAMDLSHGYYSIPLSKKSQKICSTILPWRKYTYKRLPMGIACAPDIFQSKMTDLMGDLDYIVLYIDDIYYSNAKVNREKTI